MLRYLGFGNRHYGDHPLPAHRRVNWEFESVVAGRIAPVAENGMADKPVGETMWLFPPGVSHGWVGERRNVCEVVVFHFSSVPRAIQVLARAHGSLQTRLTAADVKRLRQYARELKRHYWHPALESEIYGQRVLMDLCLMVLRGYDERKQPQMAGGSYNRVIRAEQWISERIGRNPPITDAARHIGISSSQLRRLFQRVRNESPHQVLNRLRLERAMELLGRTNAKLDHVAAECGFTNASDLCRAFKASKGCSPTFWRRETFIQYKIPGKTSGSDHTQHGRRLREAL